MRQKEGENMKDAFEKLFRAVHQFKKLNVSDLVPGLSSSEFSVMGAILQMGENGKITSSELAAKTKTLPPAVSRTLRGLEEKGYVERSVDKKDRRNTYISLTEKGWKKGEEVRDRMQDFGCSVMSQLKEEDIDQLVAYLDRIYEIAEKEIDTDQLLSGLQYLPVGSDRRVYPLKLQKPQKLYAEPGTLCLSF